MRDLFLLCTYLDGDRWESGLEPLLYPTGMSFYRPFSYRQAYFHPEQLADQLTEPSQCRSLLETKWNEGFFGVRFRDSTCPDFLPRFVPLRKVTLVSVDASDQINLAFKLGQYLKPMTATTGDPALLPIMDLTPILPDVNSIKLLIGLRDTDKATTSVWNTDDHFPPGMWDALERTISPVAKAKILHTILLRLIRVRRRGESNPLLSEEIDPKNHIWGFRLQEDTAYDLLVGYFRIKEPGVDAPPVEHQYVLTNPSEELQASRRFIQINANYRNEEIWIHPKTAGPGPIQVAIEPSKLGDTKIVDPKTAKTIGLKFPVLIEPQKWPTAKKVNLWIGIVSTLLILALWHWYTDATEAIQKVFLVMMAALASVAVNAFKDILLPKR